MPSFPSDNPASAAVDRGRRKKRTAVVYWLAFTSLIAWAFLLLFPLLPVNRFVPLPGPIKDLYRQLTNDSTVPSDAAPDREPSTSTAPEDSPSRGVASNRLASTPTLQGAYEAGVPGITLPTGQPLYVDVREEGSAFIVRDDTTPIFRIDANRNVIIHAGNRFVLLSPIEDENKSTGEVGQVLVAQGRAKAPLWADATTLTAGSVSCNDCLTDEQIEDIYVKNGGDVIQGALSLEPTKSQTVLMIRGAGEQGDDLLSIRTNADARLVAVTASGDLKLGTGTFNNSTADPDAYVTGNLEVDGTIYGNIAGTITPGGFTAGSVVFADSGGTLAQDNASFFLG